MDRTTYKEKSAIQTLGQFVSVKQDIDKEGKKSAVKYDATMLPTLMVLDSNGKVVLQHIGALDAKGLTQFLKDAAKKGAKKTTKVKK
ncbi:MAG: hypothetical protein WCG75_05535 [Armatimonadota bacterium]